MVDTYPLQDNLQATAHFETEEWGLENLWVKIYLHAILHLKNEFIWYYFAHFSGVHNMSHFLIKETKETKKMALLRDNVKKYLLLRFSLLVIKCIEKI